MPNNEKENLPYVLGSETSRLAADSMKDHAQTDRHRVYLFLLERGEHGATDDEIEVALNMTHQSASARRRQLESKFGAVVGTGERRKTRSGRTAQIYVAVPNTDISAAKGRPAKAEDDRYRSKVTVYLTRAQFQHLNNLASTSNQSPSALMRRAFCMLRDNMPRESFTDSEDRKNWY